MHGRKTITLLTFCIIACSIHPFIEMFVLFYKANWRCILFGQIFEMKREFTDGYMPACLILFSSLIFSTFIGLYHLLSLIQRRKLFSSRLEGWTHIICLISTVLSFIIFKAGHHSLCNSLDFTPICNKETIFNIEFKYFSPKYLDISYFPDQFLRMTISITFLIGWLLLLPFMVLRNNTSSYYTKNKSSLFGEKFSK